MSKLDVNRWGRWPSNACSLLGLIGFTLASAPHAGTAPYSAELVEQGRRIYQEGVLPSGELLKGVRFGGIEVEGEQIACVNCHRRSGMGSVEGDILVSPVTGSYLFTPDKHAVATMDPRRGKRFSLAHPPYTDAAVGQAVRIGVNNSGRDMGDMMPRYTLNDAEMTALTAYLKQLSTRWPPGVTGDTIHLATVIAPGIEPERRKVFLDTIQTAVIQKNASTVAGGRVGGRRHMVTAAEMILGTERKWDLHVWELQGQPDSWAAQLDAYYRGQPVFALVSGLSNTTWEPVHAFCQREQVPCWFPSVALPVMDEAFYTTYFSRGVVLEAGVLAHYLRNHRHKRMRRLIQVFRDDYSGWGAAKALAAGLASSGIKVEDHLLADGSPDGLSPALRDVGPGDAVMFWLRRPDLARLDKLKPPSADALYFSAELAGGEQGPLPSAWKAHARLVYPYELPEKRQANLAFFHSWLKTRKMALVDEPLQAEVFFAMDFLTETLAEMLDNVHRDYLLERAENMLSRRESVKSDQQVRERQMYGRDAHFGGKQEGTSIYPRLGLGVSQRFASKGGYIVRFARGGRLEAESDWIVP